MDSKPLVSVIIPSYNRAGFLRRCLEHLASQSYSALEVLIIDDGSTDETLELLETLRLQLPSLALRWFVNPGNLGANHGRNTGVREAHGKFVAFIDSDCYAETDWLEQMVAAFDDDLVAAVTGRTYNVAPRTIYELAYKGSSIVHGCNDAPRLTSSNLLVRRTLALQFPFEEDLKYGCNEEGLYLRLKAAGYRQKVVPTAVVWHDHPYQARGYFRRARILGAAAAWLVYKFRLPHRLDLLPFIAGYALLPLGYFGIEFLLPAATCFTLACAALVYNELVRKQKTVRETLVSFPVVLAYYQVRLWAYIRETVKLHVLPNAIERVDLSRYSIEVEAGSAPR
ncbi:MAG: glycosyltransferase [Bdellovibrionales bacterium]|nr:glycosyltransferase [Bdellovibrionales bacterium]